MLPQVRRHPLRIGAGRKGTRIGPGDGSGPSREAEGAGPELRNSRSAW
jgi:hypothetical protein